MDTAVKTLLIDIETSPNLAYVWGLWQQNVGLSQLVDATEMLCFAAKWLGDPKSKTYFSSTHMHDKSEMLSLLWALMDEADAVVTYNGISFDQKHINREFLENGYAPPSPYKPIDLLRTVKANFRFPSNKLDYVSRTLGIGKKVKHEGFDLWLKCMAGDEAAWKRMERYNKQDVYLLEEAYNRLLPWIGGHPNVNLYKEKVTPNSCPRCGADALVKRGFRVTNVGRYQRYRCSMCESWSSDGKRLEKVETR